MLTKQLQDCVFFNVGRRVETETCVSSPLIRFCRANYLHELLLLLLLRLLQISLDRSKSRNFEMNWDKVMRGCCSGEEITSSHEILTEQQIASATPIRLSDGGKKEQDQHVQRPNKECHSS